ncbi:hypothetical protein V8C42DRAFT_128277 [Trichoderma barbatum]
MGISTVCASLLFLAVFSRYYTGACIWLRMCTLLGGLQYQVDVFLITPSPPLPPPLRGCIDAAATARRVMHKHIRLYCRELTTFTITSIKFSSLHIILRTTFQLPTSPLPSPLVVVPNLDVSCQSSFDGGPS